MEAFLSYLGLFVFFLFLAAGGLLAVLQLPGTWLILLSAVGYDWAYHFERITWVPLVVIGVLALVAEVTEILAGMKGAQKFGASRGASWGALVGGFCGMIVFTPLIPLPIVGTVLGGLLGCFAGAFLVEHRQRGDTAYGARVGFGAALGRLAGLMIKLLAALLMASIALGAALR